MLLKKVAVINPHTRAAFQSIDSYAGARGQDCGFFAECNTIASEISSLRKQYAVQDYTWLYLNLSNENFGKSISFFKNVQRLR